MTDTPNPVFHILYVDDEESLLEITKTYLERYGPFFVDIVSSAKDGLLAIDQKKYDAIVSDYEMPEIDGIEYLKTVRSKGFNLPFIIFTGRGREEVVIQALDAGADFYLQKGGTPKVQFAELQHKIIQAIQKRRSDQKILIFNQLYAILGTVNATSVRLKDRNALLYEICRISVTEGFFSGVWIGLLQKNGTLLCPAARYGCTDNVPDAISMANPFSDPWYETARKAIDLGYYQVYQNPEMSVLHDSDIDISESDSPLMNRYTVAFPLYVNNHPIGVIQLDTLESIIFSDDILLLVDKIVSDISFALETIQAELDRDVACYALQKSEFQYRTIFENAVEGIYQSTPDGHFLTVNPSLARIFGYDSPQDMIAEVTDISHQLYTSPEDRDTYSQMLEKYHTISGFEAKCASKTGTDVWISINARAVTDPDGTISYYEGTLEDITARKEAEIELLKKSEEIEASYEELTATEEELRKNYQELDSYQQELLEQKHLFSDLIEFLPDATFVIDVKGNVIIWNKAIEALTGISADKILGKGDYEYGLLIYGTRRPILIDCVLDKTVLQKISYDKLEYNGRILKAESVTTNLKNGDTVYLWLKASPLYNANGEITGAIESIREITDRKMAEIELLKKNEDINAAYEEITATEEELRQNFQELTTYQQELLEQKHLFSDLIRFLPDATFAIDTKGNVIIWNRAIEEMTGMMADDILFKGEYEYALPFYHERRPILIDCVLDESLLSSVTYQELSHNRGSLTAEIYIPHMREGEGAYLWFKASPLYNAKGEIIGAIESIRDITDKKKAETELLKKNEDINAAFEEITATEEELRQNFQELTTYQQELLEQKHLFSDLIRFLPDATFAIDTKGNVIIWNRAIEEMTGVMADDILFKGEYEYALPFYHERRPILIDCVLDESLLSSVTYRELRRKKDGLTAEIFIPHMRGGNGAYLWFIASPLYDAKGEIIGAIESIRDITSLILNNQ